MIMSDINDKYLDLSNAEIRIKLMTMENEYEAIKNRIKNDLERLDKLDEEYTSMKQVLSKRTRGQM